MTLSARDRTFTFIGILLALYLIGRAMSASAVLNATLWERKQQARRPTD